MPDAPAAPDAIEDRRSIRHLISRVPRQCYDNPTSRGLSYLARDLALLALSVFLLLAGDLPLLLLTGWLLSSLAIAGLFVLGHDAAHGSLFKSARLNRVAGRIAMLPSLHVLSVWAYGHNRVHHAFPGCEGFDFVWHPATSREYRAMSPWHKLRHRIEWSGFGAGFYYVREIWWTRLMRRPAPPHLKTRFRQDRLAVVLYLAVASALISCIGWAQTGTAAGTTWVWIKVILVPWLTWNFLMGWAVYIQHISPEMRWHNRTRWRKFAGQVETTSNFQMPRWLNFFWHNIFVHVPHHVDPRIPFYNLPAAAEALSRSHADVADSEPYRFGSYLDTTRRCKLYDFDREQWTDYRGVAVPPRRLRSAAPPPV